MLKYQSPKPKAVGDAASVSEGLDNTSPDSTTQATWVQGGSLDNALRGCIIRLMGTSKV